MCWYQKHCKLKEYGENRTICDFPGKGLLIVFFILALAQFATESRTYIMVLVRMYPCVQLYNYRIETGLFSHTRSAERTQCVFVLMNRSSHTTLHITHNYHKSQTKQAYTTWKRLGNYREFILYAFSRFFLMEQSEKQV